MRDKDNFSLLLIHFRGKRGMVTDVKNQGKVIDTFSMYCSFLTFVPLFAKVE